MQIRARNFRGHTAAPTREKQRHQIENRDLCGEAFGRRNCELRTRAGDQSRTGFAGNCRVGHIGDCDGLHAAGDRLALRGNGVGGFAGLRDHHDDRVDGCMSRAIAILAGVFDVDRHAGEIFNHDLASEARVAAGTAGGNDQLFKGEQGALDGIKFAGKENVVSQMLIESFGNSLRLLINLAEHCVRKIVARAVGNAMF